MANIAILSEDRLFSTLISRNLQTHGHEVHIYLLNQQHPLGFLASTDCAEVSLWLLDLVWFDVAREAVYTSLADWCSHVRQPSVLLVDASWGDSQVRTFHATTTLTKPFDMKSLVDVVQQFGGDPMAGQSVARGRGKR